MEVGVWPASSGGSSDAVTLSEFGRRRLEIFVAAVLRHEADDGHVFVGAEFDPPPDTAAAAADRRLHHLVFLTAASEKLSRKASFGARRLPRRCHC